MHTIPSVITIGNFDGVHLGHRRLLSEVERQARRRGERAMAITFTPHPRQFFNPEPHFFLHTEELKREVLASCGLDSVEYLPFAHIRNMSPQEFFDSVLLPFDPVSIVLGENFTFGAQKRGNIDTLRVMCAAHGITVHSLPMEQYKGAGVSSSRIRSALREGNVEDAKAMLGRPYILCGNVEHGAYRGHTLGFATANIHAPQQVLPKPGAYATRVHIAGERELLPAMTAVTNTPTFGAVETVVETHILDFARDIYGVPIRVYFDVFLRGERQFESAEAIIRQLREDCQKVRALCRPEDNEAGGEHVSA